jgi:hypothetical protein
MQKRERAKETILKNLMVRERMFLASVAAALVFCVMTAAADLTSSAASSDPLATTDAYERIESFGFPQGILPHTITGYTFEPSSGRFTLYLEGECKVLIQHTYPLQYDKVITGLLSYGQLQDLRGIRVKAFYVWWSITAISRSNDDNLSFAVGILSAKFPLQSFDDPPICERKLVLWEEEEEEEEEKDIQDCERYGGMEEELDQEKFFSSLEMRMHDHQGFLQ